MYVDIFKSNVYKIVYLSLRIQKDHLTYLHGKGSINNIFNYDITLY